MTEHRNIGKYEIRRQIGRGAMGVVFEGFDPVIERRVAIKTLRLELFEPSQIADLRVRFKREAQAAGQLSHPHIVTIHEFGEHEGTPYIVMEFMVGDDLSRLLSRGSRLPLSEIVRLMTQLLGALAYAHERKVVHRDIKPANIFILDDGSLKVVDFGIARIEASNLTDTGALLGTPAYMSPEQFLALPVDERSDIFSAGVILYELLTGDKPFTGSVTTIMQKVLRQEPIEPSVLNPMISAAWDTVVKRAMAKKQDARFHSARQFSETIKQVFDKAALNVSFEVTLSGGKIAADQWGETLHPSAGKQEADLPPKQAEGARKAPVSSGQRPVVAPSRPTITPREPERKGSNSAVSILIAVLVAAIGGGTWFTLSGKKADTESLQPKQAEQKTSTPDPKELERHAREKAAAEQKAEAEKAAAAEKAAQETKLAQERATAEKIADEKIATEKLRTEKLTAEKAAKAAEKQAKEKAAAEIAELEKLRAEKATAERLAAEKATAERIAAEKAAAESAKQAVRSAVAPPATQQVQRPSAAPSAPGNWRAQGTFPLRDLRHAAFLSVMRDISNARAGVDFEPLPAGAVVPSFGAVDAVAKKVLAAAWISPAFIYSKDHAFALVEGAPFGLDPGNYVAWRSNREVAQIIERMYRKLGAVSLLCGVTGPHGDIWVKKPIAKLEDLKGLKIRVTGIQIDMFTKVGAHVNALPGGEIVPAMDRGQLDAAIYSDPSSDLMLGFPTVAAVYMLGQLNGARGLDLVINAELWDGLQPDSRNAIAGACRANVSKMVGEQTRIASEAIREMRKTVKVFKLPDSVIYALRGAWNEVRADRAGKNPTFAELAASMTPYDSAVPRPNQSAYGLGKP